MAGTRLGKFYALENKSSALLEVENNCEKLAIKLVDFVLKQENQKLCINLIEAIEEQSLLSRSFAFLVKLFSKNKVIEETPSYAKKLKIIAQYEAINNHFECSNRETLHIFKDLFKLYPSLMDVLFQQIPGYIHKPLAKDTNARLVKLFTENADKQILYFARAENARKETEAKEIIKKELEVKNEPQRKANTIVYQYQPYVRNQVSSLFIDPNVKAKLESLMALMEKKAANNNGKQVVLQKVTQAPAVVKTPVKEQLANTVSEAAAKKVEATTREERRKKRKQQVETLFNKIQPKEAKTQPRSQKMYTPGQ